MKRLEAFRQFKDHPMLHKDYNQLSAAQSIECERFIIDHDHLDANAFAEKVNRWKLDKPELRTKKHSVQWGLLLQCNSAANNTNVRKMRQGALNGDNS
jgi:hypothetical protein